MVGVGAARGGVRGGCPEVRGSLFFGGGGKQGLFLLAACEVGFGCMSLLIGLAFVTLLGTLDFQSHPLGHQAFCLSSDVVDLSRCCLVSAEIGRSAYVCLSFFVALLL